MNVKETILKIIGTEVKPAIGCTEPVAIALCAAACSEALEVSMDKIDSIVVEICKNVYKNGMNVGIPNVTETGLDVAAALGAAKADPSKKLEVLGVVTEENKAEAKKLLEEGKVKIELSDTSKKVYIRCEMHANAKTAEAVIEDSHDNITYVAVDGKEKVSKTEQTNTTASVGVENAFFDLEIYDIIQEIEKLTLTDVEKMLDGLKMNRNVAKMGMESKYGLGVGYGMNEHLKEGIISKDLPNLAYILTASASDVRMSGAVEAVMSSNGSGNHGLTAILPIAAYGEMTNADDEKLAKAITISHVVTAYIKHYIGRLSPLCGCSIAAATGSACGVAWLMGGKREEIQSTIQNILANQTGVLCDGAKPGCALKLGTAAESGVQAAMLAMKGCRVDGKNGIVAKTAEQSIKNLGALSENGMGSVDKAVIDIMVNNAQNC